MCCRLQVREWQINGLPTDRVSTDNAILVTRGKRWPLMIDPQEQAKRWIKVRSSCHCFWDVYVQVREPIGLSYLDVVHCRTWRPRTVLLSRDSPTRTCCERLRTAFASASRCCWRTLESSLTLHWSRCCRKPYSSSPVGVT